MTRHVWVLLHRYAGLAMTAFLIVVGLTGSLLAFFGELEDAVNPQFSVPEIRVSRLSASALLDRAERLEPRARADSLWASVNGGANIRVSPRLDPESGEPYALNFDQIILNPYTGEELGRRTWGAISEGWVNLMSFIYKLHFNLALDEWGMWALGIVALVWTLDCFVAFYLTFPARRKNPRKA